MANGELPKTEYPDLYGDYDQNPPAQDQVFSYYKLMGVTPSDLEDTAPAVAAMYAEYLASFESL